MTYDLLISFFGWMAAINIAVFAFSTLMVLIMGDWAFNLHARMFGVEIESVRQIVYSWLGTYKIAILVFSIVPYLALRMI